MTPMACQIYNTRRLLTSSELSNSANNDDSEDDDGYYDRISIDGVLPSDHLRACYNCAGNIVNGQFYGFWQDIISHELVEVISL